MNGEMLRFMKQPILCSLRTTCVSVLFACLVVSPVKAEPLAATHIDFSTAGFTGAQSAQTPVNGFTYGYYTNSNMTTGTFSTDNMSVSGVEWRSTEASFTPIHRAIELHPSGNTLRSAVRRYTVGSGGEPAVSGLVRIVGRFFVRQSGVTSRFVTVDGTNFFAVNNSTAIRPSISLPTSRQPPRSTLASPSGMGATPAST
jgi:hypothetical protein